ncbi:MAG: iron donor protein CyaY [Polyangiaceae bacterium]
MSDTVNEEEFGSAADHALARLRDALDALDLDAEVELSMGILTIELPDGAKYVINSHRAARQIWMAADRTAWHFDLVREAPGAPERWVAQKTKDELFATVSRVLEKRLGRALPLSA